MSSGRGVVIAGAGLGGFQTAASLRELGYAGRIVVVGDEAHRPYQRPPLSKAYLLGSMDEERLALRPPAFYADKKIELLTGRRAIALDRHHHHVALDDGTVLGYDHFVFACGARNRPLPVPGADLGGVYYMRTLDDARAVKAALPTMRRAVVIGAGFIGLEFAAAARKQGVEVTVIEVAERPMARALSAEIAAIFTREHARTGVRLMFGAQVMHLHGAHGAVTEVETVEHERLPADVVIVGIGVQPNVEVAAAAGLEVRNGIVVDAYLRTGDPDVSAIGDIAAHPNPYAGGATIRLESVQNAMDQARCVASRVVGKPLRYEAVPWFWSDQGELKLQIAGLSMGTDQVVLRGDPAGNACSAFCYAQGRLLAVESVNRPGEHLLARRLVGQRVPLTPAQAADEAYDLKAHLAREAPRPG